MPTHKNYPALAVTPDMARMARSAQARMNLMVDHLRQAAYLSPTTLSKQATQLDDIERDLSDLRVMINNMQLEYEDRDQGA